MSEDWLDRWENGRTGWHEADGNAGLKSHWRSRAEKVLVPLCGKSPDLVWLSDRGHDVVGIELAEKAIREFYEEQNLAFRVVQNGGLPCFECTDRPIRLYCGDYFEFQVETCDALYDRGSIVAVDPHMRTRYVEHTQSLLIDSADVLVVTLEYDQTVVAGPPFSLSGDELLSYWPGLERIEERDDLETCPPKFIKAGLEEIREVFWGLFR